MRKEKVYLIISEYRNDYSNETYADVFHTEEARDAAYAEKVSDLKDDISSDYEDGVIDFSKSETYEERFEFNEDKNFVFYSNFDYMDEVHIRKDEQIFQDSEKEEEVIWNFAKEGKDE